MSVGQARFDEGVVAPLRPNACNSNSILKPRFQSKYSYKQQPRPRQPLLFGMRAGRTGCVLDWRTTGVFTAGNADLYNQSTGNDMTTGSTAHDNPIQVGQLTIHYLIDGTATGGMGVFELTVPPGAHVPPPHSHTRNEECVYVLEGVLRYGVDDLVRDLNPGDWMFTPRGSVHQFSNPHGGTARALIVLTPDIGAQYFRDVAAVVGAGGPPDRARLAAVMSAYGLVPSLPK
jgi:quercetin dioxygenase-like cupin family protein